VLILLAGCGSPASPPAGATTDAAVGTASTTESATVQTGAASTDKESTGSGATESVPTESAPTESAPVESADPEARPTEPEPSGSATIGLDPYTRPTVIANDDREARLRALDPWLVTLSQLDGWVSGTLTSDPNTLRVLWSGEVPAAAQQAVDEAAAAGQAIELVPVPYTEQQRTLAWSKLEPVLLAEGITLAEFYNEDFSSLTLAAAPAVAAPGLADRVRAIAAPVIPGIPVRAIAQRDSGYDDLGFEIGVVGSGSDGGVSHFDRVAVDLGSEMTQTNTVVKDQFPTYATTHSNQILRATTFFWPDEIPAGAQEIADRAIAAGVPIRVRVLTDRTPPTPEQLLGAALAFHRFNASDGHPDDFVRVDADLTGLERGPAHVPNGDSFYGPDRGMIYDGLWIPFTWISKNEMTSGANKDSAINKKLAAAIKDGGGG